MLSFVANAFYLPHICKSPFVLFFLLVISPHSPSPQQTQILLLRAHMLSFIAIPFPLPHVCKFRFFLLFLFANLHVVPLHHSKCKSFCSEHICSPLLLSLSPSLAFISSNFFLLLLFADLCVVPFHHSKCKSFHLEHTLSPSLLTHPPSLTFNILYNGQSIV